MKNIFVYFCRDVLRIKAVLQYHHFNGDVTLLVVPFNVAYNRKGKLKATVWGGSFGLRDTLKAIQRRVEWEREIQLNIYRVKKLSGWASEDTKVSNFGSMWMCTFYNNRKRVEKK